MQPPTPGLAKWESGSDRIPKETEPLAANIYQPHRRMCGPAVNHSLMSRLGTRDNRQQ